jgi:hypothetical protein
MYYCGIAQPTDTNIFFLLLWEKNTNIFFLLLWEKNTNIFFLWTTREVLWEKNT